jgi:hypothetical protein
MSIKIGRDLVLEIPLLFTYTRVLNISLPVLVLYSYSVAFNYYILVFLFLTTSTVDYQATALLFIIYTHFE